MMLSKLERFRYNKTKRFCCKISYSGSCDNHVQSLCLTRET